MKKERMAGFAPARKFGAMALSVLMLLGLASCGGNGDSDPVKFEVKPELGDLGKYLSIESKEAVVSFSEFTDNGKPYVKLASTLQVKVKEDVASNYGFDLDVVVLDANMNEISDFGYYDIDDNTDYGSGDFYHYLKAGEYRAVMDQSGPKSDWEGKASAMWDQIRQKGKYIVLKPRMSSSKYVPYNGASAGSSSSSSDDEIAESVEPDTDDAASVSGGEDWDKILDEYEKYCDKTVALAKKMKAGDITAMTEYASIVESAQSLENKLNNAGSQLSGAQAARLNKIAAKMAQAAQSMM